MNISKKLTIELASVPDREAVVAEIWLDDELLAELRHDASQLRLQLYPSSTGEAWDLEYNAFVAALKSARVRLEGAYDGTRPT